MDDLLNKVKNNVNKAVNTVSVKSSIAIEKSKLNNYIATLNQEIEQLKAKLASRYYDMWVAEDINFDEIDEICQQILDREGIIKVQQQKIQQLDESEQLMPVNDEPEGMFCGQCGGKNGTGSKFCVHCGSPLTS